MAKKIYGSSTSSLLNKIAAEQEQATAPAEQVEQPAARSQEPQQEQATAKKEKKTACYSIDKDLITAVDYMAFYDGVSISDVVASALQQYASAWDYKTKSQDPERAAEYRLQNRIKEERKERGRKK